MCAKPNNDWISSLQTFLDSNPDLPQGDEIATPEPQNDTNKHPRLDIIFEKKGRGGKTATIISGFTLDDDEIAHIASKMKSRLGTGGSARGGEILIQGDRRNDVLKFLTENGFKARII